MNRTFESPSKTLLRTNPTNPNVAALARAAENEPVPDKWLTLGDATTLWRGTRHIDLAVDGYSAVLRLQPSDAVAYFHLGVAHCMRYESPHREAGDFRRAAESWQRALHLNPTHYIYRHRIEQYGPRLIKPYPFYDWAAQARREISVLADPSRAEFARPSQTFVTMAALQPPDPDGRITRDTGGLVRTSSVIVLATIRIGNAARIHLSFGLVGRAHWNNEVDPLRPWIKEPQGWSVDRQLLESPFV